MNLIKAGNRVMKLAKPQYSGDILHRINQKFLYILVIEEAVDC